MFGITGAYIKRASFRFKLKSSVVLKKLTKMFFA
jgi:hypothetical protein